MKKFLIFLLIVAVVLAVWMLAKKNATVTAPTTTTTTTQPTATDTMPSDSTSPQPEPSPAVSASVSGSVTAAKPQSDSVAIANFAFAPGTVTVPVGSTVTWKQQDSVPHSIVSDTGAFSSSTLSAGQTYSFTFTKAGTYAYHCGIHPMMKGTVIVQ